MPRVTKFPRGVKTYTLQLSVEEYEALDRMATKEKIAKSDIVRRSLQKELKMNKPKGK